ncbi:MAG TPA: hypothetical protein VL096_18555 [Pirellulaceae bacterium]|nr:hypothetical protein [Pirellulaceae bacterium]
MRRTPALVLRLAMLSAGPWMANATGHETPAPGLLSLSPATLTAHPLSPVVDPPRLLELPRDVVPVAMDFAPPLPSVDERPADDRAVQRAEHPQTTMPRGSQAWPQEEQQHGLYGAPVRNTAPPVANQPELAAPKVQRLPPIQRERAMLPPRDAAQLFRSAEPTRVSVPATKFEAGETPALPAQPPAVSHVPAPAAQQPGRSPMAAVSERATGLVRHGATLADRGAFYSARADFIQALRVISQALDAQDGTSEHSQALADGLRALTEADDFSPPGSQLEANLDLANIIAGHRTAVLKDADPRSLTPLGALQAYYTFAQGRLAMSCGHESAGSAALFGLGKLTSLMAERSPDERRLHGPKAMTLYQSALMVDARNDRAASELGVLLASFGQLEEAKRVLVHSAELAPRPETWHNLSVVHQRLGQEDLAKRALYEMQLAQRGKAVPKPSGPQVQWVNPEAFAKSSLEPSLPIVKASPANDASARSAAKPVPAKSNSWWK